MKTTSFFLSSFVQFLAVTLVATVNISTVALPPTRLCGSRRPSNRARNYTKLAQAPWPEHPLKQILPSSRACMVWRMSSAATRRMAASPKQALSAPHGSFCSAVNEIGLERGIVSNPRPIPWCLKGEPLQQALVKPLA